MLWLMPLPNSNGIPFIKTYNFLGKGEISHEIFPVM